jgi:hypothetical protein
VLGVDDPLLLPRAPRVRAGRAEPYSLLRSQPKEAQTPVALLRDRVGEGHALARPDFDLGRDELAGDRLGERRVRLCGGLELLEPVGQIEGVGIEDLELLLDADREVLGIVEDLACAVHVGHYVR